MACMRDGFESGRPLNNGRYITASPLNHGSFGMVLAAKDTVTGHDVAIKVITKSGTTNCPAAFAIDDRSEELAIHSRLQNHPGIVNLLDFFETSSHQFMVLELCSNGDLYEAIRLGKGPLETGHVRDFMLQLIDAVEYLHSRGVYHRDIKPENIFLTSAAAMKLGDFGLATVDTWSTEFAVGSDRYMAPEQYDASVYGYGYSPEAADIWAIGIVLLNVLFSRNPFGSPCQKDPLFNDFERDRQSLFDIFPNMSQDTYNVLQHSLSIDPSFRSIAGLRDALQAVVSFTIDDETLDEFCTEHNDLVPVATAAREPLRTPSITSPTLNGDSFPWSSTVLKTPPKPTRQLSTIQDEEMDLFPASAASSWQYVDADMASLSSALDSGLGLSYQSAKSVKSMLPSQPKTGFVGSLPISFTRPATSSSPYGANGFSKSWSDLWDEEEEMLQEDVIPGSPDDMAAGMDIERVSTAKPQTPRLQSIREDGRGSVTPRQCLTAVDVNARSVTPIDIPATDQKRPSLTKTKSTSILDKWAALGNFRRARQDPTTATMATATPPKTKYSEAFASFTTFGSNKKAKVQPKQRDRAPSWRQANGNPQRLRSSSFNNSKIWQDDNNWREHKTKVPSPPPLKKHFLDHDLNEKEDFELGWRFGSRSELQR